ncbi:outer membrane beta-barrel protein [Mucilaginibacter hurinus]|nr:outer membrane beta-barrel protein [Mucilaginibacter hurinus]
MDDNGVITHMATNYKLDYLTIPVMANWHFGRTKNWYLHFGPYVAFLLNVKTSIANTDINQL